jgi:AcrR family transcriptional regulator
MHEICAEAGLSAGALYRYFPSKNDIIAAIAEDDRLQAEAQFAAVNSGDDLIDTLVSCARDFVTLAAKNGDAPLVADVMAEVLRDPDLGERLKEISAPFEKRLVATIRAGQAKGEFDCSIEARRATRLILGAIDGICLRANARGETSFVAADARALLERLLKPASGAYVSAAAAQKARRKEGVE